MIRRYVQLNEMTPRAYGRAWITYEWGRQLAVCYPVPLNLIVGWARNAWLWMRHGTPGVDIVSLERARSQGYEEALAQYREDYHRGYVAGLLDAGRASIPAVRR